MIAGITFKFILASRAGISEFHTLAIVRGFLASIFYFVELIDCCSLLMINLKNKWED